MQRKPDEAHPDNGEDDDEQGSEVEIDAIVRSVQGDYIGCEFSDISHMESALEDWIMEL